MKQNYPTLDFWIVKTPKGAIEEEAGIQNNSSDPRIDKNSATKSSVNVDQLLETAPSSIAETNQLHNPTTADNIEIEALEPASKIRKVSISISEDGKASGNHDENESSEIKFTQASPDIESEKPYQPAVIPVHFYNGRNNYFQKKWYKMYPWLHYDTTLQRVLCHSCLTAKKNNLFSDNLKIEETFISIGFNNWHNGSTRLKKHDSSQLHREAISKLLTSKQNPLAKTVGSSAIKAQHEARGMLKAIFTTVMFLGKEGLALRGDTHHTGHFMSLLRLRAADIPELDLTKWMKRKNTYTSWEIQNEILGKIAHALLRNVVQLIKAAKYFSIIVDEASDISVSEQVSISIRIVNENFEAEEYFLGLYNTSSTTGENLTKILLDSLQRFDLSLENLRGQCYDGAANMSGEFQGVQSKILELQPKAFYVHCFNHSLNLALQDTTINHPFFRDILNNVHEIGTVIKASPKRQGMLNELIQAAFPSNAVSLKPRPLCPTRWTVRVKSIEGILGCYEAVLNLMDELVLSRDKISSKASGLKVQMEKAEFYLGLLLAKRMFTAGEKLSKILQNPEATVSGGTQAAEYTLLEIRELQSPECFNEMWEDMEMKIQLYSLEEPSLPRCRKKPTRFISSCDPSARIFSSAKERLESLYVNALESMHEEIARRFNQPGLRMYNKLENGLLEEMKPTQDRINEDLIEACKFYSWDNGKLASELRVLKSSPDGVWSSVGGIVKSFAALKPETRLLFTSTEEYIRHLLVIPCSSAGAERSFSRLRRIKNYLRSSMGQARLNHCCLINCYADLVDQLNTEVLMQTFVEDRSREATFGK